jgi:hypothetical protein
MGVEKRRVARGGKISFSEGGGINIVFGPNVDPWYLTFNPVLKAPLTLLKVNALHFSRS